MQGQVYAERDTLLQATSCPSIATRNRSRSGSRLLSNIGGLSFTKIARTGSVKREAEDAG